MSAMLAGMPIFCAIYEYTDDSATRDEVRPTHRAWLSQQPELRISGPTDAGGAILVFEGESAAQIEALLDQDPFAVQSLIAVRKIVGWTPTSGSWNAQLNATS